MDIKNVATEANEMAAGIAALVELIKEDYATYDAKPGKELSDIRKRMIAEFNESVEVKPGRKYIKIVANRSVWGFIIAGDNDKKFRRGDILKAASWNAPARNFARGNVIEGGYTVRWTGAM